MQQPLFYFDMEVKPYFYDRFRCKASDCKDSCCIGWEIDIDKTTLDKYGRYSGDIKNKLTENIVTENGCSCFKLTENERCPFLDKNGLCEIYTEMGEDALCDICTEHPRFHEWLESRTETGLGLCCERVCELLFETDEPFTLISEGEPDGFNKYEARLLSLRNCIFTILNDRSQPLINRIKNIGDLFEIKFSTGRKFFDSVLKLIMQTEPINREWTEYITELEKSFNIIMKSKTKYIPDETEYEKLLAYMIYRYFMKSLYEYETRSVISFCIVNLAFIYTEDVYVFGKTGKITMQDRIENVKRWSKQIEYSEENIDMLMNALRF